MKSAVMSLALVALLSPVLWGCSNGGSGGGDKPLSAVNSKISSSGSQALTGQTAIFEVSRTLSGGDTAASRYMSDAVSREVIAAAVSNPQGKAAVQAKQSRVSNVLRQGACKIDLAKSPNAQKPSSSSENGSMASSAVDQFAPLNMKVAGGGCPIEIDFKVDMKSLGKDPCREVQGSMSCKFQGVMKMSYRVLDQRLASELGVTSGHMNMTFDIDQLMPGSQQSSGQMTLGMKGKGVVDLKAVDLSGQAYLISGASDVDMTMTMSAQASSAPQMFGGMKEDLQYLDEASGTKSILSASVSMKGQSVDESYFVDGVAVTAEAYQAERDKFANSMLQFSSPKSQQGGETDGPQSDDGYPQQPGSGYPTPGSGFPQQPGGGFPQQPGGGFPTPGFPEPGSTPTQPPVSGASHDWVCTVDNYSTAAIFVGYGASQFVAESLAQQACHEGEKGSSCMSMANCEKQEPNPNAWFCKTRNNRTGRIFNSTGASKTEATYFARATCARASGTYANACEQISDSDCSRN